MRSDRINFLAVATATAGLMGFIGIFAKWYSYTYPVEGGTVTIYLDGTADTTGAIALSAGLGAMAFGCAYMLLTDPAIRRVLSLLMVISSVILLVGSILGLTRAGQAIGPSPFLPGAEGVTEFAGEVAIGLGISFVSGLIATAASILLVSRRESGREEAMGSPAAASA
jgi:hypothetical protein